MCLGVTNFGTSYYNHIVKYKKINIYGCKLRRIH